MWVQLTFQRHTFAWLKRAASATVILVLAGCASLLPDGPDAFDTAKQAEILAKQKRWAQAAAVQEQAVQHAIDDSYSSDESIAAYAAKAAEYWREAKNQNAAQASLQQAIRYQKKYIDATLAKTPPASLTSILYAYQRQAGYLRASGDRDGAMQVLQTSRPYAQTEWDQPLSATDLTPRYLNTWDLEIAKQALPSDKATAYAALDSLWSRRHHPYTVDGSSNILIQAGDLLAEAGDRDYARRMYLAAAETPQLAWEVMSPNKMPETSTIAYKLSSLGFEKDAQMLRKRLSDIQKVVGSPQYQKLTQEADAMDASSNYSRKLELEAQRDKVAADGYARLGYPMMADSLRRQSVYRAAVAQANREDDRQRQIRQAADDVRIAKYQQEKQESDARASGFMSFLDMLGAGVQSYATTQAQNRQTNSRSGGGNYSGGSVPTSSGGGAPGAVMAAGGNTGGASGGAGRQVESYRDAIHCLSRDRQSNQLADFLGNSCDFPITVKWFALNDSTTRHCAIGTGGCMETLKAHQARSSVYKLKGQIVQAACESPASPKSPNGGPWTGTGQYKCTR